MLSLSFINEKTKAERLNNLFKGVQLSGRAKIGTQICLISKSRFLTSRPVVLNSDSPLESPGKLY